jgi:hypothetical protein
VYSIKQCQLALKSKVKGRIECLKINSISEHNSHSEERSLAWNSLSTLDSNRVPGEFMAIRNAENIEKIFWDIIINDILVHLSTIAKHLYSDIMETRAGLKNQISRFIFGSKNPQKQPSPISRYSVIEDSTFERTNDPDYKYDCDSMESRIRRLADWLYLMRDFDLACDFYKMVLSDYKRDKAKHYIASTAVGLE